MGWVQKPSPIRSATSGQLNGLGETTAPGGVRKVDIPEVSKVAIFRKDTRSQGGTEGTLVADTSSTEEGRILDWFLEAGSAGLFHQATEAFRNAGVIVDKLADSDFPKGAIAKPTSALEAVGNEGHRYGWFSEIISTTRKRSHHRSISSENSPRRVKYLRWASLQ